MKAPAWGAALSRRLIEGVLSSAGNLPPIASPAEENVKALRRLAAWAQGFVSSEGESTRSKETVPRFTARQSAEKARARRFALELARQRIPGEVQAHAETGERRWSYLAFEPERVIVILDKANRSDKARERSGEAEAERRWIADGLWVWRVPEEACTTAGRLCFVVRYLAIVLGRAVPPWEDTAAENTLPLTECLERFWLRIGDVGSEEEEREAFENAYCACVYRYWFEAVHSSHGKAIKPWPDVACFLASWRPGMRTVLRSVRPEWIREGDRFVPVVWKVAPPPPGGFSCPPISELWEGERSEKVQWRRDGDGWIALIERPFSERKEAEERRREAHLAELDARIAGMRGRRE